MKVITQRDLIRTVVKRWHEAYAHDGNTQSGAQRLAQYHRLQKLDLETATHRQVTRITGDPIWSSPQCINCNKYVFLAVRMGNDNPSIHEDSFDICGECLFEAVDLEREAVHRLVKEKVKRLKLDRS